MALPRAKLRYARIYFPLNPKLSHQAVPLAFERLARWQSQMSCRLSSLRQRLTGEAIDYWPVGLLRAIREGIQRSARADN